ncbi:MAG: type II secretion system F family protein [Novosphingobium sp.]|nr:type II secretion system F family protein [Novosphingobium sp.]
MLGLIADSDFARIAVLLGVFGLVVLLAFGAITTFLRRSAVRESLDEIVARPGVVAQGGETLRGQKTSSAWARLADSIEKAGLSLADSKDDKLRQQLVAAGFTSPAAPRIYTLIRLLLIFALPIAYILFAYSKGEPPSVLKLYLVCVGLALMGLYIPNLFVRAKADRRREAIIHGFPDCLDLMLVCVEAGLGIEAAIDRVGREMVLSHPLVAELLSGTTLHLRAGASREEAFRRMADKAGVDEIRSFTTLLIQSDKLGTSLATTLRVYASEMREKRKMRAEEKAHRLPVLISVPLVACMLPVMIGVLMLPAAIRVVRQLIPIFSGG